MSDTTEPLDEALVRLHADFIYRTNHAAIQRNALPMWTIYDHPRDYPNGFIARRSETGTKLPTPLLTDDVVTGDLAMIRASMERCGLYCMMRDPSDDPVIVETWV